VRLIETSGNEVGRGLSRLGTFDLARAAGKKGKELELLLGRVASDLVVVHKDDLVLSD
jgi:glutamate 5-kinase